MPDLHANFAYSTVATAPSPATSGTSLVVAAGDGAKFPAVPFNATVWATGVNALTSNAEIVRVTARSTDTLTITRAQESTSARTVVVGDQIAATITKKTLTDVEQWVPAAAPSLAGHVPVFDGSAMAAKVMRAQYDAGATVTNNGASLTTHMVSPFTVKAPFVVGDYLRLTVAGLYTNNTGGSVAPVWEAFIGATAITAWSMACPQSANPRRIFLDVMIVVTAVGASGTVITSGHGLVGSAASTGSFAAATTPLGTRSSVTIDTTADLTIDNQVSTGTGASASFVPESIQLIRIPKL